ncbi:protein 5NUC-like [Condylostylus longicornis]|uniref:protein 5NUC-like n=1 Tax=Condylostylus longicornis TaxID=2530218 RepID=UPI00244D9EFD|nr:protein 5NUC-like [Condylostylus longicornis]XP_055386814.1 protein 5NUC-like [Condylostylus longicornis]XP_055386815.1 protein 5NUC-like [Condylostylus longicornis]XP_055386816.1 protein 5NUC-like [Condylostylus longicornis]
MISSKVLIILGIFITNIIAATVKELENENTFKFIILHNNDMHARFEQVSKYATRCSPEDANSNECYGGFARVAHEVRKYRNESENGGLPVLYLNAGDTYTGTPWFTIYRDNITAAFLNILSPDAISLGNHEFDEGTENLAEFLNEVEFPVLTANIKVENTSLENSEWLKNSTVFDIAGTRVGVIGYLTPDTKNITKDCSVELTDEIEAINEEARSLRESGINIIIALGHSGYQKDQEIAKKCPDVDIVIGGHSHTFLYTGRPPSNEIPEGMYPTLVKNSRGKEVPVVQAYAYTKYLGKIEVEFDKTGNLVNWNGKPILLNATIPEDSDVLELLEVYRPLITALETQIVGYTKVPLEGGGDVCRKEECNLGNLIADSLVFIRVRELNQTSLNSTWTDAAIGLIQGGGIRAPIEKRPDGSITLSDILTTMPFRTSMEKVTMKGSTLRRALQHSADVWDKDSNGGFLQMSGLKVVYDMRKKEGERLKDVQVLCADCSVPTYFDLNDDAYYGVIMSEFLAGGGDGFDFTDATRELLPLTDYEFLVEYIKDKTPVYPGIEDRIVIQATGAGSSICVSIILLVISLCSKLFF